MEKSPMSYVLISGASSGIGKAATEALIQQGITVFAGALNDSEAASLRALGHPAIQPVVLDVTRQDSIEAAMAQIQQAMGADGRLLGLVNCAGVDYNAPLHVLEPREIQQMIQVNFTGSILLSRAVLPLLRHGSSRLVFISSATASTYSPTVGVYGATKSGIGAFADALRLELLPVGIQVAVIEPGVVRTPMVKHAPAVLEKMLARMDAADRQRYEGVMRKIVAMSSSPDVGITTAHTSRAIAHALTALRAKVRYRLGLDSKLAAVLGQLPRRWQDRVQRSVFKL